ncbi:hypothetical protein [Pseudomonas sp. NPDC089569]|uniref:hypothetical protein n=1 Tax=Pseudomonas sp. NPDC089569 TaxID=3390722 RepID=UPI003D028E76
MTQMMQAGKIYRMRPVGHEMFTEGYFQDNRFIENDSFHVGDVAEDGAFFYRINMPDGSPKYPNHVAGHVVGLTLTRVDGTVFELIEQPA